MSALNNTLDTMNLTDRYRTFHPKAAEYIFFSRAHVTFSRTDHMLGHNTSLNKFKKIKIISSISSDHSGMILEINYKNKTGKFTYMWSLNNMLLYNQQVKKKSKEKLSNTLRQMKMEI